MIRTIEDYFHIKVQEGYNPDLRCVRLDLDPVQTIHRPLIVYLAIYICTYFFNLIFLQTLWGFTLTTDQNMWGGTFALLDGVWNHTEKRSRHISYWSRLRKNDKVPIVFIHGLGAGLMCYAEFLHQLLLAEDRSIFLIELPYVAMRLVDHVPNAVEAVEGIKEMLHSSGYHQAVFVSHSMGTGISSWVSKYASDLIAGSVMIDPICFLLHHHHVAFNFMHKLPQGWMDYLLRYVVARELYISHFISRHIKWYEMIHFGHQLKNTSIFLSERDRIIGSLLVHSFLSSKTPDVHIMPTLEHAQFLVNSKWKSLILEHIHKISRKADFNKLY
ncbi:hypothetical protein RMATCC62417_06899 [Rhizopus microsporus]|nr:hypothetical protein RMATCC62417_06899 [Rhizopus microsporus]